MTALAASPATETDLVEVAAALEEGAEEFLAGRARTAQCLAGADPGELWPALGALGWFSAVLPEDAGGLGVSPAVLGGMVRAAGRHLLPGPVLEHALVAPRLLAAGTSDEVAALLQPVVAGTTFLAWADPAAGPDAADRPRLDPDGRVRGAVRLVPHAGRAGVLAVVAADGAAERVVLVARDAAGVRVTGRIPLTPTHEVADVALDGARGVVVPLAPAAVAELRAWLRVLVAAWLSGVAERVLELTVSYVGGREQFGRAVATFQAVQHTVADMTAQAHTIANLVSLTLSRLADGSSGPGLPAALAAKAHAAHTCLDVCESALQMHGGIGFTTDYPLHHYYKSAIALRGYYGEPEEVFAALGRQVLAAG